MPQAHLRVAFIERYLNHYRLSFFEGLRDRLRREGIEFILIYGQPHPSETSKKDTATLPWAHRIRNLYLSRKIVYQPCFRLARGCDLVLVNQINGLLANYLFLLMRPWLGYRLAFMGHGYNHETNPLSLLNRFKLIYSNRADWMFAYTDSVAKHMIRGGFPPGKISVFNNTLETEELEIEATAVTDETRRKLRERLGIKAGPVGIYCSSMYKEKEIAFLLQACRRIRESLPAFQMLFLGDGPESGIVKQAASANPWIRFLGGRFGREKVELFAISDMLLLPGAVGLSIIESFALKVPLLTAETPNHGPEITFLEHGVNGLKTPFDLEAYAAAAINAFQDPVLLSSLRQGCSHAAGKYSMGNMMNAIVSGIRNALGAPVDGPTAA